MSHLARNLTQDITYWPAATPDGWGGITFGTPIPVMGKWVQKSELFRGISGEEEVSKAVVWLDTDVAIGGWLFEGVSEDADPAANVLGASEIRQFYKTPSLRNLDHERRAFL